MGKKIKRPLIVVGIVFKTALWDRYVRKGTFDIHSEEYIQWSYVDDLARDVAIEEEELGRYFTQRS